MDIIRALLQQQEGDESVDALRGRFAEDEIVYNAALAIEAGLIVGDTVYDASKGAIAGATLERLTWQGHDFLDAARDDTIWAKAKKHVMSAGAWSFAVLLEWLKLEARRRIFGNDVEAGRSE
jgi:Hypothetical protein (DUF2513)